MPTELCINIDILVGHYIIDLKSLKIILLILKPVVTNNRSKKFTFKTLFYYNWSKIFSFEPSMSCQKLNFATLSASLNVCEHTPLLFKDNGTC